MFVWCDGDLCGGCGIFYRWEREVREVVAGDAIEVVCAGHEIRGYELLVVVGGELLDTATCLIEDVEAGLLRGVRVATGSDPHGP